MKSIIKLDSRRADQACFHFVTYYFMFEYDSMYSIYCIRYFLYVSGPLIVSSLFGILVDFF